jgi:hypothetical protein
MSAISAKSAGQFFRGNLYPGSYHQDGDLIRRQNSPSSTNKKHRINICFFCASVPPKRSGQACGGILLPKENIKISCCYCVNDILTCKPALVFTIGALDEMYGLTLRWSKNSFTFMRLFRK